MELDDEVVRQACLNAAEMLSGISYAGKFGSFHLLRDLNLQTEHRHSDFAQHGGVAD